MYKVLIADDEAIERNAFRLMINKNFNNLGLAAEAANGIEAVELAREFCPDIIVMDIKMPGIDGLQAIEEIKKFLPQAKFLLLTAYGNFEYAQRALKMGAEDYLLKPIKMQKFIETLSNLIKKLDEEARQNEATLYLKSRIESVKPYIEKDILSAVIAGGDTGETIQKYAGFLEIDLSNSFCIVIKLTDEAANNTIHDNLKGLFEKQEVYNLISETVKGLCNCLISEYFNNNIILLIPVEKGFDSYNTRVWSIDFANYIRSMIKPKIKAKLFFGIGEVYGGYENIHDSYVEALKALKYSGEQNEIAHYGDITLEQEDNSIYPYEIEKALCEKIAVGDMKTGMALLEESVNKIMEICGGDFAVIKEKVYELIIVIHRYIAENVFENYEINFSTNGLLEEINCIKEINHLKSRVISYVRNFGALLEKNRQNKINSLVSSATDYINNNFNKELTLEDVAYKVGISPYYLSKLFKQKLDKNFIDYITELRIEKAKKLLKDTDKSIKEITFEVGYNSQTYFCKVFKKVSGMPASDYKNSFNNLKADSSQI